MKFKLNDYVIFDKPRNYLVEKMQNFSPIFLSARVVMDYKQRGTTELIEDFVTKLLALKKNGYYILPKWIRDQFRTERDFERNIKKYTDILNRNIPYKIDEYFEKLENDEIFFFLTRFIGGTFCMRYSFSVIDVEMIDGNIDRTINGKDGPINGVICLDNFKDYFTGDDFGDFEKDIFDALLEIATGVHKWQCKSIHSSIFKEGTEGESEFDACIDDFLYEYRKFVDPIWKEIDENFSDENFAQFDYRVANDYFMEAILDNTTDEYGEEHALRDVPFHEIFNESMDNRESIKSIINRMKKIYIETYNELIMEKDIELTEYFANIYEALAFKYNRTKFIKEIKSSIAKHSDDKLYDYIDKVLEDKKEGNRPQTFIELVDRIFNIENLQKQLINFKDNVKDVTVGYENRIGKNLFIYNYHSLKKGE